MIAAAPELAEEVQTLLDVIERGTETPEDLEGIIENAKRVLAKARGEKMKISAGLQKAINAAIEKAMYDWGAFQKMVEASYSVYVKLEDGEARKEFQAKRGFQK